MMIRKLGLALAACLMTLPAMAHEIDGKWNLSVDTPQGPFAMVFEFKTDGPKLTGTWSNDMMGSVPISDGAVSPDGVTFKLNIDGGPGGPMVIAYKGKVKGDDLTLVSKFETAPPPGSEGEQTAVAKRAK